MNERIRELAEEHGFIHEYMSIGERNDALTKYQEFAELIVLECCDWFEGSPSTDVVWLSPLTKSFIIANLKEHFGVRE